MPHPDRNLSKKAASCRNCMTVIGQKDSQKQNSYQTLLGVNQARVRAVELAKIDNLASSTFTAKRAMNSPKNQRVHL